MVLNKALLNKDWPSIRVLNGSGCGNGAATRDNNAFCCELALENSGLCCKIAFHRA